MLKLNVSLETDIEVDIDSGIAFLDLIVNSSYILLIKNPIFTF